jgi:hypothetical protein
MVVGVMLNYTNNASMVHPFFNTLFASIPARTTQIAGSLDVGSLVGASNTYLVYNGSLTTPTCDETVRWHVIEQPAYISRTHFLAMNGMWAGVSACALASARSPRPSAHAASRAEPQLCGRPRQQPQRAGPAHAHALPRAGPHARSVGEAAHRSLSARERDARVRPGGSRRECANTLSEAAARPLVQRHAGEHVCGAAA